MSRCWGLSSGSITATMGTGTRAPPRARTLPHRVPNTQSCAVCLLNLSLRAGWSANWEPLLQHCRLYAGMECQAYKRSNVFVRVCLCVCVLCVVHVHGHTCAEQRSTVPGRTSRRRALATSSCAILCPFIAKLLPLAVMPLRRSSGSTSAALLPMPV